MVYSALTDGCILLVLYGMACIFLLPAATAHVPGTAERAGDANKLSVCKVSKDESPAVSVKLTTLLPVATVAVVVLHSRESLISACATMLRRCMAYFLARDAYLAQHITHCTNRILHNYMPVIHGIHKRFQLLAHADGF